MRQDKIDIIKNKYRSKRKNKERATEKGILTLDFIFSIMAVYAISMVFTLLAFTLMFSSVVQYMAFSMSRAHISGQISIIQQQEAVEERFQILQDTYLGKLIKTNDEGWFKVETNGAAREMFDLSTTDDGGRRQKAYGVSLRYTSNILKNFKLPLLGSPGDGAVGDFGVANIFSFLYREPSTEECLQFNRTRWNVIQERFPNLSTMPGFSSGGDHGASSDNGC